VLAGAGLSGSGLAAGLAALIRAEEGRGDEAMAARYRCFR